MLNDVLLMSFLHFIASPLVQFLHEPVQKHYLGKIAR